MMTNKWLGSLLLAAVMVSGLSSNEVSADSNRRDHRTRACTIPMRPGVRFTGDLRTLTLACRAQALKINAQIAEAEDKSNDDDDDDDDDKVQVTAKNIESQKRAADAACKAAHQELIESREALAKATADTKAAAEQDVKEAEDDYNKKLDEAGAVAKKISDKAQRHIRASVDKERAGVRKIEEKLKSATGKLKLALEAHLLKEQEDIAEKEQLLAKSDLVEALQQFRVTTRKVFATEAELKSARDAALARVERAKDSFERVETRAKATIGNLRDRAQQVSADLKEVETRAKATIGNLRGRVQQIGANLKTVETQAKQGIERVQSVKTKAVTIKKRYKDLEKDVIGAADKTKNWVHDQKAWADDLFDF
jgi:hypothetical protein